MKDKQFRRRIMLGMLLVLLSAFFYTLHFSIFRDIHHIFIYLLGDVAFVFIEVLLVTLIIHQMLSEREKRVMLNKLNMVIGAFFSEVGTELLEFFRSLDTNSAELSSNLKVNNDWSAKDFDNMTGMIVNHNYKIDSHSDGLNEMRDFIVSKREFLLRLLENSNLLEHERFTELLWAAFHLAEELTHRKSLANLPETDYEHLSGDIKRVYQLLVREWLLYMEHLKDSYPYLFSLAVRTNPFDPNATVEVG